MIPVVCIAGVIAGLASGRFVFATVCFVFAAAELAFGGSGRDRRHVLLRGQVVATGRARGRRGRAPVPSPVSPGAPDLKPVPSGRSLGAPE